MLDARLISFGDQLIISKVLTINKTLKLTWEVLFLASALGSTDNI